MNICDKCNGNPYCSKCRAKIKLRQKRQKLGNIYIAGMENSDGYVKIGYSTKIDHRFAKRKRFTDNPYPITMLAITNGYMWQERELHYQFAESNICGEWFYRSQEILELIVSINAGVNIGALLNKERVEYFLKTCL